MKFDFITSNPGVLGGKPIITGTRISVDFILQLMASGATIDEIVAQYPHLKKEAVVEAILYASEVENFKNA